MSDLKGESFIGFRAVVLDWGRPIEIRCVRESKPVIERIALVLNFTTDQKICSLT